MTPAFWFRWLYLVILGVMLFGEKGDVGNYLHKSYRRIVCLTADKETPGLAQEVCNRYSARGTTLDMGGGDYIISDIFGK